MAISDYLGAALRSLREEKGLRQSQIAKLSGVARTQIADYEAGRTANPGWDKVENMLGVLGLDFVTLAHRMHELAGDPVEPPKPQQEDLPLEVFVGVRARVEESFDVEGYVRRAAQAFERAYTAPQVVPNDEMHTPSEANGK